MRVYVSVYVLCISVHVCTYVRVHAMSKNNISACTDQQQNSNVLPWACAWYHLRAHPAHNTCAGTHDRAHLHAHTS